MKGVVFHGVGDIRLDNVSEPNMEQPTDAIVRLTASAICGTDRHMVRGTVAGMVPGTILGHHRDHSSLQRLAHLATKRALRR